MDRDVAFVGYWLDRDALVHDPAKGDRASVKLRPVDPVNLVLLDGNIFDSDP